jgi:hypothetical protein
MYKKNHTLINYSEKEVIAHLHEWRLGYFATLTQCVHVCVLISVLHHPRLDKQHAHTHIYVHR